MPPNSSCSAWVAALTSCRSRSARACRSDSSACDAPLVRCRSRGRAFAPSARSRGRCFGRCSRGETFVCRCCCCCCCCRVYCRCQGRSRCRRSRCYCCRFRERRRVSWATARWPPASGQRNSRCFRSSTRARNRLAQESVPAGARASFRSRRRCRRRRRRCWQRCCRGRHCHSKRQQSLRRAVSLSPSLTGQLPRLGRPAARRSWAVMAVTAPAAWEQ